MAWIRAVSVAALLVVLGTSGALAGEGGPGAPPPASGEGWLADAFAALRVRMEARLEQGRLLERQGRLDEALATYRSLDDLWTEGLRQVREIAALRPEAGRSDAPFVGPSPVPPSAPAAPPGSAAEAVDAALQWLGAHQGQDGSWAAAKPMYAPGVTGLALLAFLGAGHDGREGPYRQVVGRALGYLRAVQDPEGCYGPRTTQHYIYNHAIASLAVLEAYGATEDPSLRDGAQRALDFIHLARNPYFAWRYGVKPGDNDTSVTSWMVMALASARATVAAAVAAGREPPFRLDPAAFEGALAWVDKVTDPEFGRVGYVSRGSGPARPQELVDRFPTDRSEAMTAAGIMVRIHAGQDPRTSETIQKGLSLISALPPLWNAGDGSIDMVYWYLGTLAAFHAGGGTWRGWDASLRAALLPSQRRDGTRHTTKGSWDPLDPWGADGGAVYSTALMTLCLEVSARHSRVAGVR